MLTQEEIEEFKKLVFEVYNITLTYEEAMDQGSRLIQLFEQLVKYSPQLASETINLGKKVVQNDNG